MPSHIASILAEIIEAAPGLHRAGTFSPDVLTAIARHAAAVPVRCSVETGAGASTLLLSHLSEDHTVFAMDAGTDSLRAVERSPLLHRETVRFVEGPTQLTLPAHQFTEPLQLVLIDGPHGYPFPELEYFYLYPHLARGALLVLDDIHIPTLWHMFQILAADDMFDLQEVVGATAFYRRTDAVTFPTLGDGWWTQGYNEQAFSTTDAEDVVGPQAGIEAAAPTPFFIDRVGDIPAPGAGQVVRAAHGRGLEAAGWAIDAKRHEPAAGVILVLGSRSFLAEVRIPRPDVVSALGDYAYMRCGFSTRLPVDGLARGTHRLQVRVLVNGGREYYPASELLVEVA